MEIVYNPRNSQHNYPQEGTMQHEASRGAAAELARYRWFLERLHYIERQIDTRPIPPGQRRPLSAAQARRIYHCLKAEYKPE